MGWDTIAREVRLVDITSRMPAPCALAGELILASLNSLGRSRPVICNAASHAMQRDKVMHLQHQVNKLEKDLSNRDEIVRDNTSKVEELQDTLAAAEEQHKCKERAWRKERAMILQVCQLPKQVVLP
jgi:hypothetical protein